jgi:pyridoxamine 5'-phosphate oxidase
MEHLHALPDMRIDYTKGDLSEHQVPADPLELFAEWFAVAGQMGVHEPNAMTLATATKEGIPSARIVLLKGIEQGGFVFYTNYESRKGRELQENPHAALLFFWGQAERQIRIEGLVEKVAPQITQRYFESRPRQSRLGAWASAQSSVIENRQSLQDAYAALEQQYAGQDQSIPVPPFWGGYCLKPQKIEFWQGRSSRLHDRILYTLQADESWSIQRLSP